MIGFIDTNNKILLPQAPTPTEPPEDTRRASYVSAIGFWIEYEYWDCGDDW